MRRTDILVIDDEPTIRFALKELLGKAGYRVHEAGDGREGLERFSRTKPAAVILDMRMPGMGGLEVLERIKAERPETVVVIVTAFGDMETTIRAMKLGAYDFLAKPYDNTRVLEVLARGLEAVAAEERTEEIAEALSRRPDCIVSHSERMREVYKLIGRIASTSVTVLITGPSGSGKEMIARAIHDSSSRAGGPFVPINCTAIPEHLIESELFGHEKGAFTGAAARRLGKFELANGGTLFLDEIADMPVDMQAKLLRVLQEREVVRVGGADQIKVDARIVAATNRNLEQAIAAGRFREDLYHRLKVVQIELPPLRERREDIFDTEASGDGPSTKGLVSQFIDLFNAQMGKHVTGVSPEARELIRMHDWPGNVRELKNAIERAVALCNGPTITPDDLQFAPSPADAAARPAPAAAAPPPAALLAAAPLPAADEFTAALSALREAIAADLRREVDGAGELTEGDYHERFLGRVESLLLETVLRKFNGNQVKTARFLGINRNTLRAKIDKYGLAVTLPGRP